MSAELNENEFDLSQKAVGISIGGSGSGQTQIGGSGGSGSGGSGGSGSGGSGGSGSGGNGGSGSGGSGGSGSGGSGGSGSGGNGGEGGSGGSGGSGSGGSGGSGSGGSGGSGSGSGGSGGSGSGGNGGENGNGGNGGENANGGDEEDGEENPAEEQEEGDSEDEQNSQNDSRLGQRCVIIYPKEFAGRLGNIKRVIFKGKSDTPIEPRNIDGYTLTYPSETEFTLFEVEYINENGKLEEGSFMDIDVLFENQEFFVVVDGGQVLEAVCSGFVESDRNPYKFFIKTENGQVFPAFRCFVQPQEKNENENDAEDGESDEDEDTQDNEQENSIVGKEFVLLRDSFTHKSGERGTILSSLGERMLEGTEEYVVNGHRIFYPIGTYYSAYRVAIGDSNFIINDFDFVFVGEEVSFVISDANEYGLQEAIYNGYSVFGFIEDSPQNFLLALDSDNPSLIKTDMCFVSLETIAIRNQRQDSQDDDDDDDDEQTPENEENVFVASLFWNYVLNERKLSGDVFTADIDENFREVTNELSFLRSFPASLYDESVIYSKETKEYGYLTTNEFDVNTIQTIDYFAVTNFNLFESVIYRNNPKELNFTYVALKYVLDNLKRKMFFVPTYQVNEESFYIMVYEKSEDEIIVVTNYEKFSVRKNGLGDYLHLIVHLMNWAYLNRFEQNLFLDFKKQTQNLLKPNIFYAKIFEDYCKALTI